jgi:hypothetical protein
VRGGAGEGRNTSPPPHHMRHDHTQEPKTMRPQHASTLSQAQHKHALRAPGCRVASRLCTVIGGWRFQRRTAPTTGTSPFAWRRSRRPHTPWSSTKNCCRRSSPTPVGTYRLTWLHRGDTRFMTQPGPRLPRSRPTPGHRRCTSAHRPPRKSPWRSESSWSRCRRSKVRGPTPRTRLLSPW